MEELINCLKSKIQCIWINTFEENRVIKEIKKDIFENFPSMNIKEWSETSGVLTTKKFNATDVAEKPNYIRKPIDAIFQSILSNQNNEISNKNLWILKDAHEIIQSRQIKRYIRDLKEYPTSNYNPIIIISPIVNIPIELSKLFYVIDYNLPEKETYKNIINIIEKKVEREICDKKDLDKISELCLGLTTIQATNLILKCMQEHDKFSIEDINNEKLKFVKNDSLVNYILPKRSLNSIGGNNTLKEWLNEIKYIYLNDCSSFGCKKPKGYLAVGIPGCSKSVFAEAIAKEYEIPLLVLSLNKIMDKLVGNSEKNIIQAFKIIKQCSPCVLLWDEVEKMIGGVSSSNSSDSGTLSRVMAECLKFLEEDNGVFNIMTSNDISQLPPEFYRSGRLDNVWYFSLPNEEERKEIINIYLKKTNKVVDNDIIDYILSETNEYTGAELEKLIYSTNRIALNRLLKENKNINEIKEVTLLKEDFKKSLKEIIPISKTSKERIKFLEKWSIGRARKTEEEDRNYSNNIIDKDILSLI